MDSSSLKVQLSVKKQTLLNHGMSGILFMPCDLAADSYQCGVDEAVCGGPGLWRDEAV